MGTKYSSVSISGYNSSPPPDDGSTGSDNQITWAKHKEKLADPVKTAIESINSNLVTALNTETRSVTANDSTLASDNAKTIEIASTVSTSVVTISLGDAASMANGYIVSVVNLSAYSQTIGRVTTANGVNGTATNVAIPSLHAMSFAVNSSSDGYNVLSRGSLSETSAFLAYKSADENNQTGNGATATVGFDTVIANIGGCFSSNTYTAKHRGLHRFYAQVRMLDLTTAMSAFVLSLVTSNRTYQFRQNFNIETNGDGVTVCLSVPYADMDAGDTATVTIRVSGGVGDTADIGGEATLITYFSGGLAV